MLPFVGSPEHKELLCRFLIESHDPYVPAQLPWPELDEPVRQRLASLPIWDEALEIVEHGAHRAHDGRDRRGPNAAATGS